MKSPFISLVAFGLKLCPHIVDPVGRRGEEVNLCCQGSVRFHWAFHRRGWLCVETALSTRVSTLLGLGVNSFKISQPKTHNLCLKILPAYSWRRGSVCLVSKCFDLVVDLIFVRGELYVPQIRFVLVHYIEMFVHYIEMFVHYSYIEMLDFSNEIPVCGV
jgi:hypothetical protein